MVFLSMSFLKVSLNTFSYFSNLVELYLNKMDPLNMSPMEALSALMELKKLVEK